MDTITIKNRKFKFNIPSPFDGCAIFDKLATHNAPFGASNVIGLKSVKRDMTTGELETFMKLCLKNCAEVLPGGGAPVVDESGELGIIGATSQILTALTVQYIVFFIDCWMAEMPLPSVPGQPGMQSPSPQTSAPSSTPPSPSTTGSNTSCGMGHITTSTS